MTLNYVFVMEEWSVKGKSIVSVRSHLNLGHSNGRTYLSVYRSMIDIHMEKNYNRDWWRFFNCFILIIFNCNLFSRPSCQSNAFDISSQYIELTIFQWWIKHVNSKPVESAVWQAGLMIMNQIIFQELVFNLYTFRTSDLGQ